VKHAAKQIRPATTTKRRSCSVVRQVKTFSTRIQVPQPNSSYEYRDKMQKKRFVVHTSVSAGTLAVGPTFDDFRRANQLPIIPHPIRHDPTETSRSDRRRGARGGGRLVRGKGNDPKLKCPT
jgi:hypothetical protein